MEENKVIPWKWISGKHWISSDEKRLTNEEYKSGLYAIKPSLGCWSNYEWCLVTDLY